jgi:hypothetical protein
MWPEAMVRDSLHKLRVSPIAAEDQCLIEATYSDVGVLPRRLGDERDVIGARPGVQDREPAHPLSVDDRDLAGERVSEPQFATVGGERFI